MNNPINKKQLNFGDFVRQQLADKESEISYRVRYYRNFVKKVKENPKKYKIKWFLGYLFYQQFIDNNYWRDLRWRFSDRYEIGDFRP